MLPVSLVIFFRKRTLLSEEKRIFNIQRLIRDETNDRFITGLHSNYLRLALPIKTLHKAAQIFLFHDEINRVVSKLFSTANSLF